MAYRLSVSIQFQQGLSLTIDIPLARDRITETQGRAEL